MSTEQPVSLELLQETFKEIIDDIDDVQTLKTCLRSVLAEIDFANGGSCCGQCIAESFGAYSYGPKEEIPSDIEDVITDELCAYVKECKYKTAKESVGKFYRTPFYVVDATLRPIFSSNKK